MSLMRSVRAVRRNGCFPRCSYPQLQLRAAVHGSAPRRLARVLVTDGVDEVCERILRGRGHVVDVAPSLPEPELVQRIGAYDAIVVRSATKINAAVLDAGRKLRLVGRAGVGVDNVDVRAATRAGVMVMNTPDGNTVSTAQLTVSLLSSVARQIPAADMSIKDGKWDRKSFMGSEVAGKTLGLVGCGRIGQVVATLARGLGMHVVGYDPHAQAATDASGNAPVAFVPLAEIWKRSDFISVHTPLTSETTNLINDSTIAACKRGVRIINCARGGIIDEAALLRALQSGQVVGAALDVYSVEPPRGAALSSLLAHPNVVCTPHLGASTEEAQLNVARDIATQVCDVFDQKEYVGVVNVPFMGLSTQAGMKPFMALAEAMGSMIAQIAPPCSSSGGSGSNGTISSNGPSRISKVVLRTRGGREANITSPNARKLLQAMLLKGLIRHLGTGVYPDMISAPALAQAAGIEACIVDPTAGPAVVAAHAGGAASATVPPPLLLQYRNLLSVEVFRSDGSVQTLGGSVLGLTPHIVQIDDYQDVFAFKPEGNFILTFRNEDRPGVVLQVLELLQGANVNVASVNVGRRARGASPRGRPFETVPSLSPSSSDGQRGAAEQQEEAEAEALCIMALDDDVPTNVMDVLRTGVPAIRQVSKIQIK